MGRLVVMAKRERLEEGTSARLLRKAEAVGGGAGRDVLSPLDLERIFGLHRGNIFHGALSLHQVSRC